MVANRKKYLDIAKGIGILLVVLGHSFPDENTVNGISIAFFDVLKEIIYSFHMPLFFFVSGYLTKRLIGKWDGKQMRRKAERLLIPYISMSLLYIPLRIYFSVMASSSYEIKDVWKIIIGISPNGGAWFLYVLFWASIFTIVFVNDKNIKVIMIISFIVSLLTRGNVFFVEYSALRYFCFNYFFFIAGVFANIRLIDFEDILKRVKTFPCIIFFAILFYVYYCQKVSILSSILAILGMLVTLRVSKKLEECASADSISSKLMRLGLDSMYIYIIHGPIQVVIRYIFWSKLQINYYICVLLMFICGLGGSILIEYFLIKKVKLLDWALSGKK